VVGALPLGPSHLVQLSEADVAALVEDVLIDLDAQRVIVTCPGGIMRELGAETGGIDLVRIAASLGVFVTVSAGALDRSTPAADMDDLNGMTFVGVAPFGLSPWARWLKRGFDLALASVGTLIVSPVLAAIAVAIKLDSQGPVFFRQVRVGRDGVPFSIIKFRSMVVDAEERKDEVRHLAPVVHDDLFKLGDDPRVTRVGGFLRRSSLDELPQILNVVRGEMSLVGPRPLIEEEDCGIEGLDRGRLFLTPGMTGPWQVLRRRVSMHEMVGIDYRYVASWSLWLDVKILLRTVLHVVHRRNL
jgi:lipopolysaccharide/colanic/teichoic acid biosynthesis glycosyltransferase